MPTSGLPTPSCQYLLIVDHLGSTAAFVNSSGTAQVNESFRAFGVERSPTDWVSNTSTADTSTIAGISRHGFTFESTLTNPGTFGGMMTHLNGRVEDGFIGRFLSADPVIPDMGNTQSFNRYSYVENNPLSRVDPSGFDDCGVDEGERLVGVCSNRYQNPDPYTPGPQYPRIPGIPYLPPGPKRPTPLKPPAPPSAPNPAPDDLEEVQITAQCHDDSYLAPIVLAPPATAISPLLVATAVIAAILPSGSAPKDQRKTPQYVVRGGLAAPDNLIAGSGRVDGTDITGFSVTSAPGMTVDQLAFAANYPNRKISYDD